MAASYKFSLIKLAPSDVRGEVLNIGVVVFGPDGLDVRVGRRLEKARSISAAIDNSELRSLLDNLRLIDGRLRDQGIDSVEGRLEKLAVMRPLGFSDVPGTFVAESPVAYEDRIATILKSMVDTEPMPAKIKQKRSRLLTQVKSSFRQERVLAKKDEGLSSHRIVPRFELDEGLTADLVLQNGAYHVIETVDATAEDDGRFLRKTIGEIGIAALVLETARIKFGEKKTAARLVYAASPTLEKAARPSLEAAHHQGAMLVNWMSADERNRFVHELSSLASPVQRKKAKPTAFRGPSFLP